MDRKKTGNRTQPNRKGPDFRLRLPDILPGPVVGCLEIGTPCNQQETGCDRLRPVFCYVSLPCHGKAEKKKKSHLLALAATRYATNVLLSSRISLVWSSCAFVAFAALAVFALVFALTLAAVTLRLLSCSRSRAVTVAFVLAVARVDDYWERFQKP
jgi:hypothetical protein